MMDLQAFFEQERGVGADLVIAIVVATEGSTYRKPGALMLLSSSGRRAGLLSGGCLEGDLHEHALKMLADDRRCMMHRYDNRSSEDPIWGLGLGCEGSMTIFLLRCGIGDSYEPLNSIFDSLTRNEAVDLLIDLVNGSVIAANSADPTQVSSVDCFRLRVAPPLRLLICGAGPDAEPLFEFAHRLGWKVTLLDHRPAYAVPHRFSGAELVKQVELDEWAKGLDLDPYSAAVVMSHHLGADAQYLDKLARSRITYIGLLGPPARKERLLADLGPLAAELTTRLRAPVGLNLGGRTPESIALSIVAEIQAAFSLNAV
jgi:xanthine/CO dehydrogenase XdhC/CoxF family maturation factor